MNYNNSGVPWTFTWVNFLQGLICEETESCIRYHTQYSGSKASVDRLQSLLTWDTHKHVQNITVPESSSHHNSTALHNNLNDHFHLRFRAKIILKRCHHYNFIFTQILGDLLVESVDFSNMCCIKCYMSKKHMFFIFQSLHVCNSKSVQNTLLDSGFEPHFLLVHTF